jgi:hypothetical protein
MASVPVLIGLSAMVLGARAAQNGLAAAEISLTAVEFAFAPFSSGPPPRFFGISQPRQVSSQPLRQGSSHHDRTEIFQFPHSSAGPTVSGKACHAVQVTRL